MKVQKYFMRTRMHGTPTGRSDYQSRLPMRRSRDVKNLFLGVTLLGRVKCKWPYGLLVLSIKLIDWLIDWLIERMLQYSNPMNGGVGLSGNLSKSAFFEASCVTLSVNFKRKGRRPPTSVGVRKLEWLPFRAVSKYPQYILLQSTRVTDRRPDRQTDKIITTAKTALGVRRAVKTKYKNDVECFVLSFSFHFVLVDDVVGWTKLR